MLSPSDIPTKRSKMTIFRICTIRCLNMEYNLQGSRLNMAFILLGTSRCFSFELAACITDLRLEKIFLFKKRLNEFTIDAKCNIANYGHVF